MDYIIVLSILVFKGWILDLIGIKKKSFAFLFKKRNYLFLDVLTLKKSSNRTIGTKESILNLRYITRTFLCWNFHRFSRFLISDVYSRNFAISIINVKLRNCKRNNRETIFKSLNALFYAGLSLLPFPSPAFLRRKFSFNLTLTSKYKYI